MRTRMIVISIVVCLLLAGLALQSGGLAASRTASPAGGGYILIPLDWQVSGSLSGGNYRLQGPSSTTGTGTPCCCLHIACVMKR